MFLHLSWDGIFAKTTKQFARKEKPIDIDATLRCVTYFYLIKILQEAAPLKEVFL
jgi:hypothetical protein